MGCVWGACTVTFNSSESVGPDWKAGLVRTLIGECTASLADHGVCVGLLQTSSDGTSRLFTVHRMGMLGRHIVIGPVVSEDCAKGLLCA